MQINARPLPEPRERERERDAVMIVAAGSSFDIQSGVHQAAIPGNTARTHTNMHSLWPAAPEEGEKPLSSFPQHLIGRLQREAELKGEREMDGRMLCSFFSFFLLEKDMRD